MQWAAFLCPRISPSRQSGGRGLAALHLLGSETAKGQGAAKARRGGASMGMRLLGRQGQFKGAWTRPSVRNIYNSLKYISYDFTKS